MYLELSGITVQDKKSCRYSIERIFMMSDDEEKTCYSRLKRLLMVTSYVLRFIKNCRMKRKVVRNGEISLDEIDEPMKTRIKQEVSYRMRDT